MILLGISGSLRDASSNTAILKAIAKLVPEEIEFSIYDGMGMLPFFSPDIDTEDVDESVLKFRALLTEADGIIISTPEYAFGIPGVLKNALDWTVSSGDFYNKPTVAISASPSYLGGDKALASLMLTLGAMNAKVAEEGSMAIPFIRKKMNSEGEVVDQETLESLKLAMNTLPPP